MKLKDYNWALEGLAALILFVAFILMWIRMDEVSDIVVKLTGLGILFFTFVRIVPIIKSRNDKDYVLVMFTEMLVSLIAGVLMLFLTDNVVSASNNLYSFSRLSGIVLFLRGVSHFWTTSKRYELHDIVSFIVHVVFLSFGFLFLWNNNLQGKSIVIVVMILSIFLSGYFGYRTFKGYNTYRIQKMNALKVNDYLVKKEDKTINVDPTHIEGKINPKKIEEPKEERPKVDVN
ncbi:MAG: hypothetical protein K0Q49_1067 [Haloplasmataceae bacterium]|jgi:hypothetical protein|nr:hypothetical protein [Haloplasmataceae bacterium]